MRIVRRTVAVGLTGSSASDDAQSVRALVRRLVRAQRQCARLFAVGLDGLFSDQGQKSVRDDISVATVVQKNIRHINDAEGDDRGNNSAHMKSPFEQWKQFFTRYLR